MTTNDDTCAIPRSVRQRGLRLWISRWVARILVEAGGWRRVMRVHDGTAAELLAELQLDALAEKARLKPALVLRGLRRRLEVLEEAPATRDEVLFENVSLLGDALGLDDAEREILLFATALQLSTPLHDAFNRLDLHTVPELAAALARILRLDPAHALSALRLDRTLLGSHLVHVAEPNRHRETPLYLADGLGTLLLSRHESLDALLSYFFRPPRAPSCALEDFPHLAEDAAFVLALLRRALEHRAPGVNVLIHGAPGTGKSELVRVLARELGAPLYEVSDEDAEGHSLNASRRFGAYVVCQRIVASRHRALVMFDEIEDVFPREPWSHGRDAGAGKAWTNRMLEQNAVPALWISNGIEQIDPAYLRRFDFVLELRSPPVRVRRAMLERAMAQHLPDDAWLRRTSADERLTPAAIDRAARITRLLSPTDASEAGKIAARALESTLTATRGSAPAPLSSTDGPSYDLGCVNASHDLERLVASLTSEPRGALCLYGPPGTGKTAFAQHLAERLDRPLIARRASDLLGCYVGQTEARLAEMFRTAKAERAVLFLDEADSFLQDRSRAQRSWEVTQVNELLVQLEAFDGVFLCATNAFEQLDVAALRRFAVKLRFDPPRPEQRWTLFRDTARRLGVPALDPAQEAQARRCLDELDGLTPGDFRTVLRGARLIGPPRSWLELASRLEEELRARPEHRRASVGFSLQPKEPRRELHLAQAAKSAKTAQ